MIITEEKQMLNLARALLSNHDEMADTAKYIQSLSIMGLTELRRLYPEVPGELIAQEQLLKDMISATAVYLAQTGNWYNQKQNTNEETTRESEELS